MKIQLIGLGFVFIVIIGFVLINMVNKDVQTSDKKEFVGPVPDGYDEQHFRETGETKLIEEKDVIVFKS